MTEGLRPAASIAPTEATPAADVSLARSRVLIVDDNQGSRTLLGRLVTAVGVGEVAYAVDGEDGLDKVERFRPDLVILDVRMPRMDGFEMCRRLRANRAQSDLPVLIETAFDNEDARKQAFLAGATDMVSKPVVPVELMARVRIHLERRILIQSLRAYRERVAQELSQAQAMQLALVPQRRHVEELAARHTLRISSHFEASSELGGDIWDIFDLGPRRFGLYLADFSGHGVNAALNTFRLHTLVRQLPPDPDDPGAWLASMSARLKGLLPPGQFATMLYAIIDTDADTMTYASAGAPSPIRGIGETVEFVDSAGLFLGISATARYESRTVPLPPHGFAFLYSDVLTDSVGPDGRAIGEAGLLALVQESVEAGLGGDPLATVLERFLAAVPRPLPDDLTAVWIARG